MKKKFNLLMMFLVFTQTSFVYANCPDFAVFFKEVDPAKSTWKDLYRLYSNYHGCDDGVYGEGYSDFVVQSLAKHWDRFDELVSLNQKDPTFQKFVINHIDATTDPLDLDLLLKNTRERCPSTSALLCNELEKATLFALKSIESYKI